jgi:hypothetical protein
MSFMRGPMTEVTFNPNPSWSGGSSEIHYQTPWLGYLVNSDLDVDAPLTVSAAANAVPGQYSAVLSAGTSTKTVFINALGPTPADSGVTPCSTQVNRWLDTGGGQVVVGGQFGSFGPTPMAEVLPISALVAGLFTVKAASPGQTTFEIGARTLASVNSWNITLAPQAPAPPPAPPPAPLMPDEAIITLHNTTTLPKELWTVNSADCGATLISSRQIAGQPMSPARACASVDLPDAGGPLTMIRLVGVGAA